MMKICVTLNEGQCQYIVNTRSILMSQAVTVPSLMIMTSTVSEESRVRDRQTHRQTHRHSLVYVNFFKSLRTLTKKEHTTKSIITQHVRLGVKYMRGDVTALCHKRHFTYSVSFYDCVNTLSCFMKWLMGDAVKALLEM